MDESEQMALLAFGDPGFFDFLAPVARAFKAAAPIISTATSFIPVVGPIISKAVDYGAGLVQDDSGGDKSTLDQEGTSDDEDSDFDEFGDE